MARACLRPHLYDPISRTFSSAGQNSYARLYHSNSLLLPDATVFIIGGDSFRGTYEQRIESTRQAISSILSVRQRPSITGVPFAGVGYGSALPPAKMVQTAKKS
jgi:hypothetical protein